MSGMITDAVKAVAGPIKALVVDRIQEYVRFINTYQKNVDDLLEELGNLCSKKQDIDLEVKEGKDRLRVMTKETTNWMKNLYKLIEREEMKRLMKEDKVAEIAVKMMDQRIIKKLFNEDREIFDIVVRVVKDKCNQPGGDAEEDADYKKLAKIAREVIQDISEEFKKFMKTDDAAVAAVNLLNYSDLEKLMKDDNEMAMILIKAEDMNRQEVERRDHDDEKLCLIKHDDDVQSVGKDNIVSKKFGVWRERMNSLMGFLEDENFKKGLPDEAKIGLEVMNVLSKEPFEDKGKSHGCCGWCVIRFEIYRNRHDISELAEIMVNDIRSILANCPQRPVTRRKIADELEALPSEFMVGLESREELVQNILMALQDDKVDIVGVFGIGGGGKTTLAKEVAYKRATSLFDKRVVVEVSEVPNIKGIQEQISEGINLPLDNMHTVAQRAQILYNGLKAEKTRILIILDNVWRKLKLNEVGIPLRSTKDSCCKLLITTRERQVCNVMDIQDTNIFEVGLLNERESLNLFENQTGMKVGSGEFKPVADRLLRKCGGLPLAIVTSGCALKGQKLPMWCHFADTSEKPISSQVSNEYREIYSILETSYKLIDSEVKRIFFFLACLSPLDSAVAVDDLMRYGIGLDLFQRVDGLSEAMEQASVWANELVSSSLLQKGLSDGQVKVHDIVRASAISFSDKGKDGMTLIESIPRWMCLETFEKFTAISLLSGNDFSRLSGVNAPMLEILLLEGDISSTTLSSDFFEGMQNLKVLCLSKMNFNMGLPESLGELMRLKTLHLQHCKLKDIKLIGKLVNLLILSFRGSSLEELAVEIGELCKLRLLDMGECKGVKSIPSNILSRLSHLEGLYMNNGYNDWSSTNVELNDQGGYNQASGKELVTLSHLNVLEMVVSEGDQLLSINNGPFVEKLGKFRIRLGDSIDGSIEWDEDVSGFRYIFELGYIDESQYNSLRVLLKKTDCLLVNGCDSRFDNFVPQVDKDGFKDLKYLKIVDPMVKCIINSKGLEKSAVFANLETLRLGRTLSLEMICDGKAPAGIFSNLRRLALWELPYLKHGLPSLPLNLSEVSIQECNSLYYIMINRDKSVARSETDIIQFPFLKSLELFEVDSLSTVLWRSHSNLISEDRPFFNSKTIFPSLENLELSHNKKIVTLWSKACDTSSFQNLKFLEISFCDKLRSLGSPSLFAALFMLEKLTIRSCHNLREVITKEMEENEVREHVIAFPRLESISMTNLDTLGRFYGGTYELEFPNLKSLSLSKAKELTNFDGSQDLTTFFSNKIEFPSLEELEVQKVSKEVVSLWNWLPLDVNGENKGGTISSNPVPNLRKLTLGLINGSTYIPDSVSSKLSDLTVTDFSDIKTLFSNVAVNREAFWTYSQLPKLENLSVEECDSLEQLFDNEDGNDALVFAGRLTGIMLKTTPKLLKMPTHMLKNICTLSLTNLRWKYVFSADLFIKGSEQLQLLENLVISDCEDLEVIIMDELVVNDNDRVYSLPRLKSLELNGSTVANFASKPSTALHFGSLEKFSIMSCHEIQSFYSGPFTAPNLKEVELWDCDNLQYFLSGEINDVRKLPSLERVLIGDCCNLLSFSSKALEAPKLSSVNISECCKMTQFLPSNPNKDDILDLPSLDWVTIEKCWDMQSFSSGGMIKAPNLCNVAVDEKDYSTRTSEELQDLLLNLYQFHIRDDDYGEEEEEEEDEEEEEEEEEDDDDDDDDEEEEEEEEADDADDGDDVDDDGGDDDDDNDDEDVNKDDGEIEEQPNEVCKGSHDEQSADKDKQIIMEVSLKTGDVQ